MKLKVIVEDTNVLSGLCMCVHEHVCLYTHMHATHTYTRWYTPVIATSRKLR